MLINTRNKSRDNSSEYVNDSPITIQRMDINTNLQMKRLRKIIWYSKRRAKPEVNSPNKRTPDVVKWRLDVETKRRWTTASPNWFHPAFVKVVAAPVCEELKPVNISAGRRNVYEVCDAKSCFGFGGLAFLFWTTFRRKKKTKKKTLNGTGLCWMACSERSAGFRQWLQLKGGYIEG